MLQALRCPKPLFSPRVQDQDVHNINLYSNLEIAGDGMVFVSKQPSDPVYEMLGKQEPEVLARFRALAPKAHAAYVREAQAISDIGEDLTASCREMLRRFSLMETDYAFFKVLSRDEKAVVDGYMNLESEAKSKEEKLNLAADRAEAVRYFKEYRQSLFEQKLMWETVYEENNTASVIDIFTGVIIEETRERIAFLGSEGRKTVYGNVMAFLNGAARRRFPETDYVIDSIIVLMLAQERDERTRLAFAVEFLEKESKQRDSVLPPLHQAWAAQRLRGS